MSPCVRTATGDLRQLHEQFVAEQRFSTRLAPATLRGYRTSFELLLKLMPQVGLQDLRPETLTEFFRRLDTRRRRVGYGQRSGVTASTVATHRGKLGRFFAWLAARHLIAESPFASMPYPPVSYEGRQYLDRNAIERILAALTISSATRFQRTRNIALFATLLYTGLRRGELLGLRIGDVNLDRLTLAVCAETSKSRTSRVVPINAALAKTLEDYLDERRKVPFESAKLFVSATGTPLTLHGLKHLTERVVAKSGVRFHLHQMRHTFAVNFLHLSGDVAKLKQLLGHRDIRMTSGYLRSLPTRAMRSNIDALSLDTLL